MTSPLSHHTTSTILLGRKNTTVPQDHVSPARGIVPEGCEVPSPCVQHHQPWWQWERPGRKPSFLNGSFPAFSNGLDESCDGALGFRAKETPFIVKCFQCWWEALLWHCWRLNYSIYCPPPLGTVHRRKCRAGHWGKIHRAALPGCHRHLETPWGQAVSAAPLPARDWASREKSPLSSAFPEIGGRVGCSKDFLWKSDSLSCLPGCRRSQFTTFSSEAFR